MADLQELLTKVTQMMAQQQEEIKVLHNTMKAMKAGDPKQLSQPEVIMQALAEQISMFRYDPKADLTFERWYKRHEETFLRSSLDDAGKRQLLLLRIESHEHRLYSDFIRPKEPKERSFGETVTTMKTLFHQPESLFCRRWKCFQIAKSADEDFATYAANVNKACEDFKLKDLKPDDFKALIFILGLKDQSMADIRTRLHNKVDSDEASGTLEKLVAEANRLLNVKADCKLGTNGGSQATVARIGKKPEGRTQGQKSHQQPSSGKGHQRQRSSGSSTSTPPKPKYPCTRCGAIHFTRDCEYQSHTCHTCSAIGHKEGYCSVAPGKRGDAKQQHSQNKSYNRVSPVRITAELPKSADASFVYKTANDRHGQRKFIKCKLLGKPVVLQLDTAADVTIITAEMWKTLGEPAFGTIDSVPVDASNNPLNILGILNDIPIDFNGQVFHGRCYVAKTDQSLFGIEWITLFNLWDKKPSDYCLQVRSPPTDIDVSAAAAEIRRDFADVFDPSLGCCNITLASLQLIDKDKTVYRPKREVPYAFRLRVQEELNRLEALGIITPVTYSKFAAPIVIVQKPNGNIRICADYSSGLNAALLPHDYPIPTPESIFATLSSCYIFSKIDLSDAYLQIPVDEDTKKMLTITTHRGLYTFNRLCPGVKPAAGIFQQSMDRMLQGVEGAIAYFDDVLIASANKEQHHATLIAVFSRLRECNMRVRADKCLFFQSKLKFLGVIIDKDGIRPDPEKTEAIEAMPAPTNAKEVRSFLGAVNFYIKFIDAMSTIRTPLDNLLRTDVDFEWTKECHSAFEEFKRILRSPLMLTHFNPELPICVAADASKSGIGCCIYHRYPDGKIKAFYHASRRLTPTEQRYAQIEKEALAIVFAVTKFHKYIFGREFELFTDHRPLLFIFGAKTGIPPHTANRLQRWAIILLAYQFTIHYTRTEDFGHADVLSRLIADRPKSTDDVVIAQIRDEDCVVASIYVDEVNKNLPVKFGDIVAATENDQILPVVKKYVRDGWPPSAKHIPCERARKFFSARHSLSIVSEALTYADRTVIPLCYREKVLHSLHVSHQGMARTKAIARGYVYWPSIDADIETMIRKCRPCAEAAKNPVKCLLSSWPIPSAPWQRIHMDFAGPVHGKTFFIIVDAYSKWPEVWVMTSTVAATTIEKITEAMGRFGQVGAIVSDNGPQFTSELFKSFCSSRGIKHLTTAPYSPMSNGLAERFVDTFKRAISKFPDFSVDAMNDFLRDYRATPHPSTPDGQSPAELMLGRKMILPLNVLLPPEKEDLQRNTKMEEDYNRRAGAKDRTFSPGERTTAKIGPDAKWIPATVIERIGNVMYNVHLEDGRLRRVHANQLRSTDVEREATNQIPFDMLVEGEPAIPPVIRTRNNWRQPLERSPVRLRSRRI